jgi:hypothetical protein
LKFKGERDRGSSKFLNREILEHIWFAYNKTDTFGLQNIKSVKAAAAAVEHIFMPQLHGKSKKPEIWFRFQIDDWHIQNSFYDTQWKYQHYLHGSGLLGSKKQWL